MKIHVTCTKGTKEYLPDIVKALNESGYQVTNKQDAELCLSVHKNVPAKTIQAPMTINPLMDRSDLRIQKMVLVIGRDVLPRRQLVADLGLRQNSRAVFVNNYLKPAEDAGLVAKAYPNVPSKPGQAYRLTAKGLDLYSRLTK